MNAINSQCIENIKEKIDHLRPGHKGWVKHMIDCMSVDICPKCGSALFANLKISKNIVVYCSACDWEDSTEHNC